MVDKMAKSISNWVAYLFTDILYPIVQVVSVLGAMLFITMMLCLIVFGCIYGNYIVFKELLFS